ncbi:hypothetical protein [Nocardia tenerifensis]|uniref:hypothetical protein n=1 Tax=Nocardia tenerifensis TaxID=228006 RepID=UPI0002DEADBD|nr:hypothetical protein [Nocardia tenerifensis]
MNGDFDNKASELATKADEEITVPIAKERTQLVSVAHRTWLRFDEITDLGSGKADPHWKNDRDLVDQRPRDPWPT